jgi:hypothetical protein
MAGDIWGLLNQGGWTSSNQITVAISDAKLVVGGKSNGEDVRFAEPSVGGVPFGAVTNITDNQGWGNDQLGILPTTGGTGRGLTVSVGDRGSGYSIIVINNPGSGYTTGDEITVTSVDESISETFTITASALGEWTHVAVVNDEGTPKVYYNGVEQSAVSGTFDSLNYSSSSESIYIGRLAPNYGGYFDGKMAMIRISTTAKYATAFTPSVTYGVEADTKLFLSSDAPLVDLSYYELNGIATSASNGGTLYFSKATYPNLNNQIQAGNTVVDTANNQTSTLTGAVFTADPDNWGVNVSSLQSAGTKNFSGARPRNAITNNGVTESMDFPIGSMTAFVSGWNTVSNWLTPSVAGNPDLTPVVAGWTVTGPLGFTATVIGSPFSNGTNWVIPVDASLDGFTGSNAGNYTFTPPA